MNTKQNSVHYLEIVTSDIKSMCDLYTNSFGWEFQPEILELGNARVAELEGGSLCGICAPMHPTEKPTMRMYLRVSDVEYSVKEVIKQGAEILLDRMEIPGYDIIAIYKIGGIEKGLWEVNK